MKRLFQFCQALFCVGFVVCAYFVYAEGWRHAFDGRRAWTVGVTIGAFAIAALLKDLGHDRR